MKYKIPLFDLSYQNRKIKSHIHNVINKLIRTSSFILGPDLKEFEKKFASLIGVRFAVGVNSGTDALIIGLKSLGIGPDDEVITVPNSYIATAQAIVHVGAKPVFVDVDDTSMNIDLELVKRAITKKTKAVIPVHLYGLPVDIPKLRKIVGKGVYILEDCAQSHGATVNGKIAGSMGDVGCFSLHPAKILSSIGDAGIITTSKNRVYKNSLLYRNFGLINRDKSILMGYNSRMDSIYAAIMNKKIDLFDNFLNKRLQNAKVYFEELDSCESVRLPSLQEGFKHVHNFFVIRVKKRDKLKNELERKGIECKIHYPIPIHLQKSFEPFGYKKGDMPNCENQARTILTIPVAEHLNKSQIRTVAAVIRNYYE